MKFLFILTILFSILTSVLAIADEAPIWWNLPNKGKNCISKNYFYDKDATCGSKGYQIWTCITPGANPFLTATSVDYLLVGEFKSDSGEICNPVFFVKKVIRQN